MARDRAAEAARAQAYRDALWGNILKKGTSSMNNGWIPEGNYMNYVYARALSISPNTSLVELSKKAASTLNAAHASLGTTQLRQAYSNLQSITEKERSKEIEFCKKYLEADLSVLQDAALIKALITTINKLQPGGAFWQAVNGVLDLDRKYNTVKRADSSSDFGLTQLVGDIWPREIRNGLSQYIRDHLGNENIANLDNLVQDAKQTLINIMGEALQKTIDNNIDKQKQYTRSEEYLQTLEKLFNVKEGMPKELFERILGNYFSDKTLKEEIKRVITENQKLQELGKRKIQSTKIKIQASKKGNVTEVIDELIFQNVLPNLHGFTNKDIKCSVKQTGGFGKAKSDVTAIIGQYDVDYNGVENDIRTDIKKYRDLDNQNVDNRSHTIKSWADMLNKFKDIDVVEISAKNYDLTSTAFSQNPSWGAHGAKAQDSFKLNNFQQTFSALKIDNGSLSNLIFILANSADNLINGTNLSDVENYLASVFVGFLFDDIALTGTFQTYVSEGVNILHIFNFAGIYIPLSVFLEGLYDTMTNNYEDLQEFVDIDFKLHAPSFSNVITKEEWDAKYQEQLSSTEISTHFFGGFISFIQKYFK